MPNARLRLRALTVALLVGWALACSGGSTPSSPKEAPSDDAPAKEAPADGVALVEPWSELDGLPPAGATVVSCTEFECVFEHGETVTLAMIKPYGKAMKKAGYERMAEDPVHRVMPFIKHQQGGIIVNVIWGTREQTSTQVKLSFQ